jgi:hypothetical protein
VITADTYTRVLPGAQRPCADAAVALVLAAAGHTRQRIKANAAKNPAPGHDETDAFRWPARRQAEEPQVTHPPSLEPPEDDGRHPCGTHHPHRTGMTNGLNHISAAQTPDGRARPKGLEPLTF